MASVPSPFQQRRQIVLDPSVTLIRTDRANWRAVGEFILDKVQKFASTLEMVEIWIPA
jgi:uncharacterized protein (UPF0261 family)